jgi:hypothetical protein
VLGRCSLDIGDNKSLLEGEGLAENGMLEPDLDSIRNSLFRKEKGKDILGGRNNLAKGMKV